ncbi:pentatricopeptide repeat-containing protein At2g46050, mitochondrial-like [Coffea arabica]|uniref:Pentatricopeptide repeat-containing protein At2g46050, mitochondrial-like n=1 Tax=Coffea arabica TaxID=13443 RepID=A0A6P6WNQ1_COFAR|nr:pentatricopeptide repeat-containing protein At2g46050, mitochondrial-like [Coffea arabica]
MIKCLSLSIQAVLFKRRLSFLTTPSITRPRGSLPTRESAARSACSQLTHKFISSELKHSAKFNLFHQGKQLHGQIIKLGYQNMLPLQNLLLNFYLNCKCVSNAHQVFGEMIVRNIITWNTMICGIATEFSYFKSNFDLGICYFGRMLTGEVRPDWITFRGLFRLCVDTNNVEMSQVLHCFVMKLGLCDDLFLRSALVDMYGKLRLVEEARHVFIFIKQKDLVLWNTLVSCYVLNSFEDEALRLYKVMRSEGLTGDEFTFTSLLNSCASFGNCQLGRGIHGTLVKLSFDLDVLVASSLVDMYAKNESLVDARKVFDMMISKNVVSWNTMIVGYGQYGDGVQAMKLVNKMFQEDFHPDELTLASVFISCGILAMVGEITQLHAYTVKNGLSSLTSIANAMISGYSKCGSIVSALQAFRSILEPDLVSWTSMIGAYGFHGFPHEATELFKRMLSNGVKPDRIAFLEVLSSCGHGGLVNEGLRYFALMTDVYKLVPDPEHYACLVDLLGRVGLLKEAFDVLTSIPVEHCSDAMGAFLGACKVHGNLGLAEWAAEKLFTLEPKRAVNYTLLSNMYASNGAWSDVATIRRLMREMCYPKAPGCSWMEIAGKVYSFVSGDKSHPHARMVYSILGHLYELMKVEVKESTEIFNSLFLN